MQRLTTGQAIRGNLTSRAIVGKLFLNIPYSVCRYVVCWSLMSTAFRRPFLTRHGQFFIVILYTTLQGVYMVVHGSISCQLLRYDFCMHTWTVVIMFCALSSEVLGKCDIHGMICIRLCDVCVMLYLFFRAALVFCRSVRVRLRAGSLLC